MTIVAVDIDSTLYDFETPCRQKFLELGVSTGDKSLFRGAYVPWVEWRSPADACGLEKWIEVINLVHDDDMIASMIPFEGAVDTLTALAEQHRLLYVSNRATERYAATADWLFSNDFPDGKLVCNDHHDKRDAITHCQYLIDDRPKTLVEFVFDYHWRAKHGPNMAPRKAFGLMFEYNRALTDIPNIYLAPSWNGLAHYLTDKGVLKEVTHA